MRERGPQLRLELGVIRGQRQARQVVAGAFGDAGDEGAALRPEPGPDVSMTSGQSVGASRSTSNTKTDRLRASTGKLDAGHGRDLGCPGPGGIDDEATRSTRTIGQRHGDDPTIVQAYPDDITGDQVRPKLAGRASQSLPTRA